MEPRVDLSQSSPHQSREDDLQLAISDSLCKKRKLDSDIQESTKRTRISEKESDEAVLCNGNESNLLITDLPDDVLLIILSHLDHYSLIQLKETCTVFSQLCRDYTLWRNVECMLKPAGCEDLIYIVDHIDKNARSCKIRGSNYGAEKIRYPCWLHRLVVVCPNLLDLALPGHSFDCRSFTIFQFPRTLTRLDLSGTHFVNLPERVSFFKNISTVIPNLRSLNLAGCPWFEPHSLMAISKCAHLEDLYVNDCIQMRDCLAYCGLATQGGFKKLKTIDLRRCHLSNSELSCFSTLNTLVNVYLEIPPDLKMSLDTSLLVLSTAFKNKRPAEGGDIQSAARRLAFRNFPNFNDCLLLVLTSTGRTPFLNYLDITGSGLPLHVIENVRIKRPCLKLIADDNSHLAEIEYNSH